MKNPMIRKNTSHEFKAGGRKLFFTIAVSLAHVAIVVVIDDDIKQW